MSKSPVYSLTAVLPVAALFFLISGVAAAPVPPIKQQTTPNSALTHTEARTLTQTKPSIVCANKGTQLVNVSYKIVNDVDSGDGGNYWAYDSITRQLQIWQDAVTPGKYCADIKDKGTFATQAGVRSPGSIPDGSGGYKNGGVVDGTEVGTLSGGMVFSITGIFHTNDPTNWPATGSTPSSGNGGKILNTGCVISPPNGTLNAECQSPTRSWEAKYFTSGYVSTDGVWGWFYIGQDHSTAPDAGTSAGRWNNFITGDSGDVLDVD